MGEAVRTVSVAIVTHNRKDDLLQTLEKLEKLDPQPLEIIVYLDGCTDGSFDAVSESFPSIKLMASETNEGSVPGRDHAFRAARGDVIVSLDDDSAPMDADFCAQVIALVENHPEAGIFAFQEVRSDWPSGWPKIDRTKVQYIAAYPNCAGAVRRSLYGEIASYPPFFFHMYEETDFCVQAYGAGFAVLYDPSIKVFHRYTNQNRIHKRAHFLNARNEFWSCIMRCPFPQILFLAPFRVLRQLQYAASRGLDWVPEEPKWWGSAAKGFGEAWRSRKPVDWQSYWSWMNLGKSPITELEELTIQFPTIADRMIKSTLHENRAPAPRVTKNTDDPISGR